MFPISSGGFEAFARLLKSQRWAAALPSNRSSPSSKFTARRAYAFSDSSGRQFFFQKDFSCSSLRPSGSRGFFFTGVGVRALLMFRYYPFLGFSCTRRSTFCFSPRSGRRIHAELVVHELREGVGIPIDIDDAEKFPPRECIHDLFLTTLHRDIPPHEIRITRGAESILDQVDGEFLRRCIDLRHVDPTGELAAADRDQPFVPRRCFHGLNIPRR